MSDERNRMGTTGAGVILSRRTDRKQNAFTLVELLVVIAIITILASIGVYLYSKATGSAVITATNAQRAGIETFIANFTSSSGGAYPPDNALGNYAANPLYYELHGTWSDGTTFNTDQNGHSLTSSQIKSVFGRDGFSNVGTSSAERQKKDVARNMDGKWFKEVPASANSHNVGFYVMALPQEWPSMIGPNPLGTTTVNGWFYKSTGATNNPDSYDLWGYLVIRRQTNVISNWK